MNVGNSFWRKCGGGLPHEITVIFGYEFLSDCPAISEFDGIVEDRTARWLPHSMLSRERLRRHFASDESVKWASVGQLVEPLAGLNRPQF
jgi:hypothetical protein